MNKFFVICPLNFEHLAQDELIEKWPLHFSTDIPQIQEVQGGLELECTLEEGLYLNQILKIPSKILLRIKEQKCRDFPKLFNTISKIKWKTYLKRSEVTWHLTSRESRLINTKKMESACHDGLMEFFKKNPLSKKLTVNPDKYVIQSIFIRVDNDDLTISIDTSGELLHKRALKDTFRGHAPLRENLASALLYFTLKSEKESFNLIDPMCGSGTFLKEALSFYSVNTQRTFAYQGWNKLTPLASVENKLNINKLFGFDNDKDVIEKIQHDKIKFIQQDAFKAVSLKLDGQIIIICNPPYGKRVKLDKARKVYFKDLIKSIKSNYNPTILGIIIPSDIQVDGYKKKIRFFNNGIWVNFFIF